MSIAAEARQEGHASIDKTARYAMILGELRGKQLTAREIAYNLGFRDLNAVKPRLTELAKAGRVVRAGKRKDTVTGVTVSVYEVAGNREPPCSKTGT